MALSKAELACDKIINTLKISKLNFCVQETPFSAYITIRKTFSQNFDMKVEPESQNLRKQKIYLSDSNFVKPESDVVKALEKTNEDLLRTVEALKSTIEYEVAKHKAVIDEKLVYIKNIESELDASDKHWKALNKEMKDKNKQIHDLNKEHRQVKEDLDANASELVILKAKLNKERKDSERKARKDKKLEALSNLKSDSKYNCDKCDENFEIISQLKSHEQFQHMISSSTQVKLRKINYFVKQPFKLI